MLLSNKPLNLHSACYVSKEDNTNRNGLLESEFCLHYSVSLCLVSVDYDLFEQLKKSADSPLPATAQI
jgi:hypothetical protein